RYGFRFRGRRLDDRHGRGPRPGGRPTRGDPRQCGRAASLSWGPRLMPSFPALLEGRDLDAFYGQSHVLRSVSLAIGSGQTIALMGRNGMGKTTLIRTLLGLVRARRGQVLFEGEDVTHAPTFAIARRGVAYVPEGRGIFTTLSVKENLAIAAGAAGC